MTLKARIIVRFKGPKKSRIAISILGFLSPLKQTIIRTFLVSLVFINGIRELTFAHEQDKQQWANAMATLLTRINQQVIEADGLLLSKTQQQACRADYHSILAQAQVQCHPLESL